MIYMDLCSSFETVIDIRILWTFFKCVCVGGGGAVQYIVCRNLYNVLSILAILKQHTHKGRETGIYHIVHVRLIEFNIKINNLNMGVVCRIYLRE